MTKILHCALIGNCTMISGQLVLIMLLIVDNWTVQDTGYNRAIKDLYSALNNKEMLTYLLHVVFTNKHVTFFQNNCCHFF